MRAELTTEIKERALRQLGEVGAPALSLRAIAREMGMSSSALFRYFPNRDALLTALIVDAYSRLAYAAEHAHDAAAGAPVLERWVAICHGVRDWAVAHPHEYALVYGSPVPGYTAPEDTAAPAWRVPRLLTGLLVEIAGSARPAPGPTCPRTWTPPSRPPHRPSRTTSRATWWSAGSWCGPTCSAPCRSSCSATGTAWSTTGGSSSTTRSGASRRPSASADDGA